MINNTAAGGERICFHVDGEACEPDVNSTAWSGKLRYPISLFVCSKNIHTASVTSGNVAHGCLHGVQIFIEDGVGNCSMIRNFVVYKAWDYGIYHQTQTSVIVRDTVIADSTVRLFSIAQSKNNFEAKSKKTCWLRSEKCLCFKCFIFQVFWNCVGFKVLFQCNVADTQADLANHIADRTNRHNYKTVEYGPTGLTDTTATTKVVNIGPQG